MLAAPTVGRMTRNTEKDVRRRGFHAMLQAFSDEPTLANFERYRAASAAYDEVRGIRADPTARRERQPA
jgi:hypothetical protein